MLAEVIFTSRIYQILLQVRLSCVCCEMNSFVQAS